MNKKRVVALKALEIQRAELDWMEQNARVGIAEYRVKIAKLEGECERTRAAAARVYLAHIKIRE